MVSKIPMTRTVTSKMVSYDTVGHDTMQFKSTYRLNIDDSIEIYVI